MRLFVIITAGIVLSGCCGQLKETGLQHAKTTKQVGQTLQASVDRFECDAIEDVGKKSSCETAAGVVKQQAEVLIEAADTLTKEMQ